MIVADPVLNDFIKERVTVNSSDRLARITSGQDSTAYRSIARHLVRIKFRTTASDALITCFSCCTVLIFFLYVVYLIDVSKLWLNLFNVCCVKRDCNFSRK